MSQKDITRRAFLAATTTTAAAINLAAAPNDAKVVPGKISPNQKLNIAAIGAGGKGGSDIWACRDENVVALCDVDADRAEKAFTTFDKARKFKDYRNMLEAMPEIDACTISTPDHTHAPAAYMAMKLGKHVYVQKPLSHTVAEARLLTKTAAEMKVTTQMGNQGHCGDGVRDLCEMIWSGAIGQIKSAHAWTHRPVWANQGMATPLPPMVTPENMDWDRWIGSAPWRPYNSGLAPHDWRAWLDFGGGSLGDMGCHILDPVYMALKLVDAKDYSVEVVEQKGQNTETFPIMSTIKYVIPGRGDMGPVEVFWHDGHWPDPQTGEEIYNRPARPEGVPADEKLGDNDMNGSYFIGEKGIITCGEYGGRARLLPASAMEDYKMPDPWLERIPREDPHRNWIDGIKGGYAPASNFNYSGPLTEFVNFGNLVVLSGKKLDWDNTVGRVTNVDNPDEIVSKEYRTGWELPC